MEVKWRRVGMMPTTPSMSTTLATVVPLKNSEEEPWSILYIHSMPAYFLRCSSIVLFAAVVSERRRNPGVERSELPRPDKIHSFLRQPALRR